MSSKSLSHTGMQASEEDFEKMYQKNEPLIYRYIYWRTRDEMLAQDLTSSVFEKAWRTRNNFSGGSSRAWLYRIARTTLIDYWRKIKEIPDDGSIASRVVSDTAEPGEALDQRYVLEELQKALMKLPTDMHDVLRLRFIEGMSTRETAQRLHISEANVRVIQYRALKKMKDYLQ